MHITPNMAKAAHFIISLLVLLFSDKLWFGYDKIIALISALGSIATIGAFIFLFLRDENKEAQLAELRSLAGSMAAQAKSLEQRLLLTVRPDIWKNEVQFKPYERIINVQLNNRGEDARLLEFIIESDTVELDEFNKHLPYLLLKGENRYVFMRLTNSYPETGSYKLWVIYEDKLLNRYQMLITGEGQTTRFSQAELVKR